MNKEINNDGRGIDLRNLRVQRILDSENQDRQLIVELQNQLRDANEALETKTEDLSLKAEEIRRLRAELKARRSSEMPGDPDGYYRALGLHPTFAQGLSAEEIKEIVQHAWRSYSKVFHADRGGNLERMKKINVAHDYFVPRPKQDTIPK